MKNLSFGKKLLLSLSGVIVVSLVILITITTYESYTSSEDDAKTYMRELAKENSEGIKADLNEAILVSKQIADKLTYLLKNNKTISKEEALSYLKSTLKNAKAQQGVWFGLKKTPLFTTKDESYGDSEEILKTYDEYGVFSPYVERKPSGKLEAMNGAGYNMKMEWISATKKDKKEHISKPFLYANGTLMTVVSYPVYYNGEYVGAVGTVFALESLYNDILKLKIYENGYGIVFDDRCSIVALKDKKVLGKDAKTTEPFSKNPEVQKMCKKLCKSLYEMVILSAWQKRRFFIDSVGV